MTSFEWHGRHIDGVWRSADEVPRSSQGRPLAYVAENGYGQNLILTWNYFHLLGEGGPWIDLCCS